MINKQTYIPESLDNSTIPFNITISDRHIPFIMEEEFMVVVRERVDVTTRGPKGKTITNAGNDVGRENYNDKSPYRPVELPQGFQQLKGNN